LEVVEVVADAAAAGFGSLETAIALKNIQCKIQ
jgi:hypothetical protein